MSNVYWSPWAQKWFDDDARRRELVRTHEERAIKRALGATEWSRSKRQEDPDYFQRKREERRTAAAGALPTPGDG